VPLQHDYGNVGQANEVLIVKLDPAALFRLDQRFDFLLSHLLGLAKIALVLVRFDHVASFIVNANHSIDVTDCRTCIAA
jgi:hypothetical protein